MQNRHGIDRKMTDFESNASFGFAAKIGRWSGEYQEKQRGFEALTSTLFHSAPSGRGKL
ncbi:MAG: hypothetical protein KDD67_13570 [Ignavibacteriae bacterium]|nr:hypothetical protein [Ignavibacteriota bacterium]